MLRKAQDAAAKRLLRAAVYFTNQHQLRLSVSNPRPYLTPSKPGEYPRQRTGAGKAGVVYAPSRIPDIIREGLVVRIGQAVNTKYMLILELARARKGFKQTAKDTREVIEMILTGEQQAA